MLQTTALARDGETFAALAWRWLHHGDVAQCPTCRGRWRDLFEPRSCMLGLHAILMNQAGEVSFRRDIHPGSFAGLLFVSYALGIPEAQTQLRLQRFGDKLLARGPGDDLVASADIIEARRRVTLPQGWEPVS